MENFALNKAIINEHESDSLMLALKALQATKYPQLEGILEKMGAVFKNSPHNDWVCIEFSPWGSGPNEDNKFLNIKTAILNRRAITFDYVNAQGGKSNRRVEPAQLVFKGQAWYLRGYCNTRNNFRIFRISRMKNLFVTDRVFESRPYESSKNNETANDRITLTNFKLRFQPAILHRVYDDFDEELISRNIDGTCDVILSMPEDEWVYGYILSFGSYVEVIEPGHLRELHIPLTNLHGILVTRKNIMISYLVKLLINRMESVQWWKYWLKIRSSFWVMVLDCDSIKRMKKDLRSISCL